MHRVWELRRTNILMQELCRGTETTQKTVEKEKGGVSMNNVKPGRQRIKNLLFKLNDEDRNTLVCLIAKAGYSVRIGKERPEGRGQTPLINCQYRIRKLTPLECWRLMGFSDKDFLKAEAVNSNTQLYKQAGNSIVKNILVAIFGQMIPKNGGEE